MHPCKFPGKWRYTCAQSSTTTIPESCFSNTMSQHRGKQRIKPTITTRTKFPSNYVRRFSEELRACMHGVVPTLAPRHASTLVSFPPPGRQCGEHWIVFAVWQRFWRILTGHPFCYRLTGHAKLFNAAITCIDQAIKA